METEGNLFYVAFTKKENRSYQQSTSGICFFIGQIIVMVADSHHTTLQSQNIIFQLE